MPLNSRNREVSRSFDLSITEEATWIYLRYLGETDAARTQNDAISGTMFSRRALRAKK